MNRLILIGNGFDLAHGLQTKYEHFIEWICKTILDEFLSTTNEEFFVDSLRLVSASGMPYKEIRGNTNIFFHRNESYNRLFMRIIDRITFKNSFFAVILYRFAENWSDIEAIYNDELHKKKNNKAEIKKLNEDLDQIKKLLAKYLEEIIQKANLRNLENAEQFKRISFFMRSSVLIKDFSRLDYINSFLEETFKLEKYQLMGIDFDTFKDKYESITDYEEEILQERLGQWEQQILDYPSNILILNFNYTPLITRYVKSFYTRHFHVNEDQIHGKLEDTSSMIFGYGDEEAEEYEDLENLQIKGLLNNVKSINYLQTDKYRKLLQFIDSDNFQVFTMGMSCGLADRTLLRKVFQHKNCVSIKPFYYKSQDNTYDDYTDIIQNISRCFKDKDQLREKVVNKEFCIPLPQYNDR